MLPLTRLLYALVGAPDDKRPEHQGNPAGDDLSLKGEDHIVVQTVGRHAQRNRADLPPQPPSSRRHRQSCVRGAEPERPREALTSRPLLLCAVGRVIESGRQITLRRTITHAEAARAQRRLTGVSLFLSGWLNTAEPLTAAARWERIGERILRPWLRPAGLLPGPSG